VQAHHAVAGAELLLAGLPPGQDPPPEARAALDLCDRALTLLAGQPPAERVPVYLLRLTAMERLGAKGPEVQAWIQGRQQDPAAAEVAAASASTALGRLVGQPAPPLKGKRLDAAGGDFDLAAYRGRPVLIDWFATWCAPCRELAPTIAAFAQAHPRLAVVSVSLDNKDSLPELPRFLARHGMTWPVVGDGLGWDTEADDAWHVDAIPSLILVAPDGTVAATDLVGDTPDFTTANIEKALARFAAKPQAGPVIP
jgi:thiol-disulfide isomerase/thioredoxin